MLFLLVIILLVLVAAVCGLKLLYWAFRLVASAILLAISLFELWMGEVFGWGAP